MLSYIAYSQILFPVGDVTITIAKIVLFSDVKYIYLIEVIALLLEIIDVIQVYYFHRLPPETNEQNLSGYTSKKSYDFL